MSVISGNDAELGRTLQALRLHVPPGVAEDSVTRRGEAREVRHLAAGNEADPAAGGQAEQLAHPSRPRRQPLGRHGDRERAADHKPEVARPRGCDQAGLRVPSELLDAGLRPDRAGGQALDEPVGESRRVVEHLVARVH